jgi:hypothetical protein
MSYGVIVLGAFGRASNRQVIIEAFCAVGLVPAVKSAWIVLASAQRYVGVPKSALRFAYIVVKSASIVVVPAIAVPGTGAACGSVVPLLILVVAVSRYLSKIQSLFAGSYLDHNG